MLAEGAANVARHYNVIITEKTQDWLNLFMALSAVYGTRFVALLRKNNEQNKQRHEGNVVDLKGHPIDENGMPVNPLTEPLNPNIS